MAIYQNKNDHKDLTTVEFTPVSEGNFVFFHIKPRQDKEAFAKFLTEELGQKIVAQTLANNEDVFITHGDKTKEQLLDALNSKGHDMAIKEPEKKFNAWKWRGILSMIGHPMQLATTVMLVDDFDPKKHGKLSPDKIVIDGGKKYARRPFGIDKGVFAISNLAANIVNITFGAQKSDDKNRLIQVKNQLNDELGEAITNVDELFPAESKRAAIRKDEATPKTLGEKSHDFMARNSVTLGEVGLRYFGGVALAFPMKWENWKGAFSKLASGKAVEAFKKVRNPDDFMLYAGSFWLGGKTLAFFAKTPDPYNPDRTSLDKFREEYLFKISTATEAIGSTTMAGDSFVRRKTAFRGKVTRDYLGGVGGSLFTTAFLMRLSAPYGIKQLDTEEVYAHATDTLAKTPPEKLPQLMADTAAYLTEHMKDQNVQFGDVYNQLMKDLYCYHHIALDNLGTEPAERAAKAKEAEKHEAPKDPVTVGQTTIAHKSIAPADIARTAGSSYADRALQSEANKPGHSVAV